MVGSSRVAALRSPQHELSDPARAELGGTLPGRWSSDHRHLPLQCHHSCVGGPRSCPGVGVACHCWSCEAVGGRLLLGLRGRWRSSSGCSAHTAANGRPSERRPRPYSRRCSASLEDRRWCGGVEGGCQAARGVGKAVTACPLAKACATRLSSGPTSPHRGEPSS